MCRSEVDLVYKASGKLGAYKANSDRYSRTIVQQDTFAKNSSKWASFECLGQVYFENCPTGKYTGQVRLYKAINATV